MAQSSRTFRIFVSSTFSDLKEERNALQEKVFPRLRDLAVTHGCRFQAIDLRWGVSEEAALDQQTMKICLNEIERCQKTSPKLNFLVLLGDRYGWRPIPSEIPASEFERIISKVANDEKPLLEQWYRRDDNAVPPVYCLKARSGEYVDYSAWEAVETRLRQTFLKAIEKLSLSTDETLKYIASATEQEIVAGALKVSDAKDHVFCFFRAINGLPIDETSKDFHDSDTESSRMQKELKARLKKQLAGNVHEYTAQWQKTNPSLDHLEQLCEDVYSELSKVILAEAGKLEKVDALDAEITAHETFGKDRARVFIGRADILNAIEKYIAGNDPHPLAVWGASGSGKSSLMAKAVEQAQKNGQDVLYRFIGVTPESSNGRALLESLCRQISRHYGADESTIPSEYKDLVQEFPKRLALAKPDKPLTIFLDALDQLSDTDNARSLIWLPANLPENVHLIISTLPGECLQALEGKLLVGNRLEVQPMSVEDGKNILTEWLSGGNRQLQKKQEEHLLGKFQQCGLPLYLKLAFEEARLWKSYEALPELSNDIPGILRDLFKRLSLESNHGQMLVSRGLGYIAAGKNGLSEDELIDVLSMDKEVLADFQRRSPKSPRVDRLPVVIWSRLYFDLEPYLTERSADGTSLLAFYHRQMREEVENRFFCGEDKQKYHFFLANFFGKLDRLFWINKEKHQPDRRKIAELAFQQAYAGQKAELKNTLTTFDFLHACLTASGPQELIADFDLILENPLILPQDEGEGFRLIRDTLRLSSHILARDAGQLAPQLIGRLLSFNQPEIAKILKQSASWTSQQPWLRPCGPCLTPPGGPELFTLAGHSDGVSAVAITPDGRLAVSASMDQILKVWDLQSGQERFSLAGHTGGVSAVAITPDGRLAVSASKDQTLKVWDLQSGQERFTLAGHTGAVNAAAITPDGHLAVSASMDKTLKVWDLQNGQERFTLAGHSGAVNDVAITPDGCLAVSASIDHTLMVWNLQYGQERFILAGHKETVNRVTITPDGRLAVSASGGDKTPKVWDLQTGQERFTLAGHTSLVVAIAITPDGRLAVSASWDQTLKVWDLHNGQERFTLAGHTSWVRAVAITPDGRLAVSASVDHTLKVWDLQTGQEQLTLAGHSSVVEAVAITPDGRLAVSASDDRTLKVWDLQNGQERFTLARHSGGVSAVTITSDGRLAVSASLDHTLKVWDLQTGQERFTLAGHSSTVNAVAITPDGRLAVSASGDKTLKVWDLQNGQERLTLAGHSGGVEAVAITSDGRLAVSVSEYKTLKVWDLQNGKERFTLAGYSISGSVVAITPDGRLAVSTCTVILEVWDLLSGAEHSILDGHSSIVSAVAITPDGRLAVSASRDHTLKVWDLQTGQEQLTLAGHSGAVEAVAITPDGRLAVSASVDRTLKVWDLQTGKERFTLAGHSSAVEAVAITSDGCLAVSASVDKTFKVWALESGTCLSTFFNMGAARCIATAPYGYQFIAGDSGGNIYSLSLENILPGAIVVSTWRKEISRWQMWRKPSSAFGCPQCRTWSEIPQSALGSEIPCPKCGKPIKLNPFTIEGDWRPIARAWKKNDNEIIHGGTK